VHIAVGGHSEAAARRAGRLGDGWFAAIDSASIAELGLPGAVERLEPHGVHRLVMFVPNRDPAGVEQAVGHLARRVGLR
jgi:hypothetical protein